MSGIALIFNLDGRPADPELLDRMLDLIPHRGRDGLGRRIDGPIALGHAMLRTTPESLNETQPLSDAAGALWLVMDGRVDNRDELRADLASRGFAPRDDTDAELVLRACEAFGPDAPARIIGDFAFALWDGRNRELFCARDPSGIKPFYYFCDGRTFLAASELRQILAAPMVTRVPDERMIAVYLCGKMLDRESTIYRDVRRLPGSHSLVVDARGIASRRYFDLDPSRSIRYRTDADYGEHYLQIFKEAVRCRMRSVGGVACQVSGGLDSSSIFCLAAHMIRSGELDAENFVGLSAQFDDPDSDERSYAADVARKTGLEVRMFPGVSLAPEDYRELARRYQDFAGYPNGVSFANLHRFVVERGFRVLLTGLGGDQWISGAEYYYADLLGRFRLFELVRLLGSEWRFGTPDSARRRPVRLFLTKAVWPLLPDALRSFVKRRLLRRDQVPAFIGTDFAKRVDLRALLETHPQLPRNATFAQRELCEVFVSPWMAHAIEMSEREASSFGIEERHPFYDRRLIEFCLALPEDQRYRHNIPKVVLRTAMSKLLPDSVLHRITKGVFVQGFLRSLDAMGGERAFANLAIGNLGWVDREQLARAYRAEMSNSRGVNLWPFWTVLLVNLWYENELAQPCAPSSPEAETRANIDLAAPSSAARPRSP
jgi:asparagine synthase (glutamine-hydrolysing)